MNRILNIRSLGCGKGQFIAYGHPRWEHELGVYWAWNGVGSVLASVLALMIAMASGFVVVMLTSALCYAVAALLLPSLARPVTAASASS